MTTTFKLEHEFTNIPLEKFVAHLNDPKLNRMLEERLSFDERTLVSCKENGDDVEWRFRVKKSGELPAAVKKVLKTDAFGWQETSRLVRKNNCIHWQIVPESKLLKFHGEGTCQFVAQKHGCKRTIEGSVTVDIPLVGKLIEAFIVSELTKSYEVEPSIQEDFYAQVA